jgi:hypothetical protein
MTISGISGSLQLSSVGTPRGATPQTAVEANDPGATQASVSKGAQYLSQLKSMAPADAKQLLSQLAGNMRSEASQVGGPRASHLTVLADKLTKAADSGDLSSLMPRGGGHARGGHAAYAATGSSW